MIKEILLRAAKIGKFYLEQIYEFFGNDWQCFMAGLAPLSVTSDEKSGSTSIGFNLQSKCKTHGALTKSCGLSISLSKL